MLYETGIADTLNREDAPIGSGAADVEGAPVTTAAEATAVSKQTAETLMAGERIMEALDVADAEIAAFREYEEAKTKGGLSEEVAPPARNQVLAAYDLTPEEYVLRVVEKVTGTALYDALLVLPFGKVVSLMQYLNCWAQQVSMHLIFVRSHRDRDLGCTCRNGTSSSHPASSSSCSRHITTKSLLTESCALPLSLCANTSATLCASRRTLSVTTLPR